MNYPKNKAVKVSGALLALLLAFSPLAGFAKEHDKNDKSGKVDAQAKIELKLQNRADKKGSEGKNCLKAIGHLIAPGWIKANGTTTVSADCELPSGIFKKLNRGSGTTTATTTDSVAPVISSVLASPRLSAALIEWTTDERSDSKVYYGTTTSLDISSTSTLSASARGMTKDHEVKLSNLSASTTYYFKVASKDASGNLSVSSVMSFTTKSPSADSTYPVISNVSTSAGTSTIGVSWKTSEPATTKVYYGTGIVDVNSTSTAFVSNSSLVTDHSITITGLSTSTPYTLVLESKDGSGNASLSNSLGVTTGN
jgi:hypothetical protein